MNLPYLKTMSYKMPEQTPIVVVYKVPRGRKERMKVFTDLRTPDPIIAPRSKKYLPTGAEILEIGVGSSFEAIYKKKYKI